MENITCSGKPFEEVRKCCKRRCYKLVSVGAQEEMHAQLIACSIKETKYVLLSTQMKYEVAKTKKSAAKKNRGHIWQYTLHHDNAIDVIVCKTLFKKLFQVEIKLFSS